MLLHPHWIATVATRRPRFVNIERELAAGPGRQLLRRPRDVRCLIPWDDLKRFRDRWPRKLLLKGVLRADDAERAVRWASMASCCRITAAGSSTARSADSMRCPRSFAPWAGAVALLVDGGVRRGSDIAKAVALGAEGVLLGRAPVYGLAAGGEKGVAAGDLDPRGRARPNAGLDRLPRYRGADFGPHRPTVNTPRHAQFEATCCGPAASRALRRARSMNCCRDSASPIPIPSSTSMPSSAAMRGACSRSASETATRWSNSPPRLRRRTSSASRCTRPGSGTACSLSRPSAHERARHRARCGRSAGAAAGARLARRGAALLPGPLAQEAPPQAAHRAIALRDPRRWSSQARRPVQIGDGLGALRRLDARSPRRIAGIHECRAGRRLRRSPGA